MKHLNILTTLLFTLSLSTSLFAVDLQTVKTQLEKNNINSISFGKEEINLQGLDLAKVRALCWGKFKKEKMADKKRQQEHKSKKINFAEFTMKYDYKIIGKKPKSGYPLYIALHGGGNAPSKINDSQWKHMKVYYKDSVKNGIYLAPRAINDTWNLHSRHESFPMYDRIIENMILFENVDPNRVYILGFSAGGNGACQVGLHMADRWAAANMSAGGTHRSSPRNLYNLPFLIQVGEKDTAYKRHQQAVKFYQKILNFRAQEKNDGYIAEVNVHVGKPHNFLDNHPRMAKQKVIANPVEWLEKGQPKATSKNTNAIHWLDQHTRQPLPKRVIWDLNTRTKMRHGVDNQSKKLWESKRRNQQFYWLDLADNTSETLGIDEVIVSFDKAANSFNIEKSGSYLKLLLSSEMINFSKPLNVKIGNEKFTVNAKPDLRNILQSLVDRGDKNYIFEAAIVIHKTDKGWSVKAQ